MSRGIGLCASGLVVVSGWLGFGSMCIHSLRCSPQPKRVVPNDGLVGILRRGGLLYSLRRWVKYSEIGGSGLEVKAVLVLWCDVFCSDGI